MISIIKSNLLMDIVVIGACISVLVTSSLLKDAGHKLQNVNK